MLSDLKSWALENDDTTFHTLLLNCPPCIFDNEGITKFLIIPNPHLAKECGINILQCYQLHNLMKHTVQFLALHGNKISRLALAGYWKLIVAHNTKESVYSWIEAECDNSFYIAISDNPQLDSKV